MSSRRASGHTDHSVNPGEHDPRLNAIIITIIMINFVRFVQVVIKSGKHVLLDVQPATLTSLTIQSNASLVWGNVPNLELKTEYILLDGAFHMGSPACRFKHAASIKLTGMAVALLHGMGRYCWYLEVKI